MAQIGQPLLIRSLAEYLETVKAPVFLLGLGGAPVTPWYLGQSDPNGKLLPALYRGSVPPELEREMLREFRMLVAEFVAPKGTTDRDWLLNGHANGLPSRIIEWHANSLAALFAAVESADTTKHGRVWVFNPWAFNDAAADLAYVPMIDEDYIDKYVVKLSADPEAASTPKAEVPMAFRPYRTSRPYNTQNTFFTIHGKSKEPLDAIRFNGKKNTQFLTSMLIDGTQKKLILRELYNAGITRATLFPGAGSIAKTVTYRYSKDFVAAES